MEFSTTQHPPEFLYPKHQILQLFIAVFIMNSSLKCSLYFEYDLNKGWIVPSPCPFPCWTLLVYLYYYLFQLIFGQCRCQYYHIRS